MTIGSYLLSFILLMACGKETPQEEVGRLAGKDISDPSQSKQDENKPLTIVDELPQYKGGMDAFSKFVHEKVQYPEEAKSEGFEAKVMVEFVIDKTGKITAVKAKNSPGHGFEEAAEMAVSSSPNKWIPGRHQGQKVAVKMVLPVTFSLKD